MATYGYTQKRFSIAPLLILLVIIIFAMVAVVGQQVLLEQSHAVPKHGSDALTIRKCIDNNGPAMTLKVDASRFIQLCQVDGRFGLRVLDKVNNVWQERTAYFKDAMKNFSDVVKWMDQNGYTKWTKPLP